MTVYLDYLKKDGEVVAISILDELNNFHDYDENDLQNATEFLIEPGWIVVFGMTQAPLKRLYEGNPILEEYNFFKGRWLDLRMFLNKATGLTAAITKMAAGITEEKTKLDIQKIEYADYAQDATINRVENMHDRLNVIRACYESADEGGVISFYFKGQKHDVDFDLTEPGHPLSVD